MVSLECRLRKRLQGIYQVEEVKKDEGDDDRAKRAKVEKRASSSEVDAPSFKSSSCRVSCERGYPDSHLVVLQLLAIMREFHAC